MNHRRVCVGDSEFHVASLGAGPPLLLLHGWPEFWLTWEPVIIRLADRFTLFAPDLRGFGESDKPPGPWGPQKHGQDMVGLLEVLGLSQVGVVGHDVGGAVMQSMARLAPERLRGLFFFNFSYPGIGSRMATPDRLSEIWYQSFHQMPMAASLVGASRDTCRAYIGHFLRHWASSKHAFDDVLEAWVDNFLAPGNLQGGFDYYCGAHSERIAMMTGAAAMGPPIALPTCVRWTERDAIFPVSWTDRLGEVFTNLDLATLPNVGHFPHREDPDRAASEIARFFES